MYLTFFYINEQKELREYKHYIDPAENTAGQTWVSVSQRYLFSSIPVYNNLPATEIALLNYEKFLINNPAHYVLDLPYNEFRPANEGVLIKFTPAVLPPPNGGGGSGSSGSGDTGGDL